MRKYTGSMALSKTGEDQVRGQKVRVRETVCENVTGVPKR